MTNYYTAEPQSDYVDAALVSCLQIHLESPPGDILVFLTGQEEIESLEKLLKANSKQLPENSTKLLVYPLYAALPPSLQVKIFQPTPPGYRKIILSTNIAETSVTINGIRFVIDSGFVKERSYIPNLGMESLQVQAVSKAAARQRSGRAGREAAGTSYRLFSEGDFQKLEDAPVPEIKRCNLSSVILTLKAIHVDDVVNFDYMDRPPREARKFGPAQFDLVFPSFVRSLFALSLVIRGLEELYALGALNEEGKLTPVGKKMSELPLDPTLSKVLLYSQELECTEEIISVIALLSVDTIFFSPRDKREKAEAAKKKFLTTEGDHITLLNVLKAYRTTKDDKDWCQENFINSRSMKLVLVGNRCFLFFFFCRIYLILSPSTGRAQATPGLLWDNEDSPQVVRVRHLQSAKMPAGRVFSKHRHASKGWHLQDNLGQKGGQDPPFVGPFSEKVSLCGVSRAG